MSLKLRRSRAVAALTGLRPRIEAGTDGRALVIAVDLCGIARMPMPEWLATEWSRCASTVLMGGATSWDDAFGQPWPNNYKPAAALRRRRSVIPKVTAAIRTTVAAKQSMPIDKSFWEQIGAIAGLGATAADNAYRKSKLMFGPSIQSLRINLAICDAASAIIANAPDTVINSAFFAEISARSGVPREQVEAWFRSALDEGLTFSPEPPTA
jgi:hypothetical protein